MAPSNYVVTPPPASQGLSPVLTSPCPAPGSTRTTSWSQALLSFLTSALGGSLKTEPWGPWGWRGGGQGQAELSHSCGLPNSGLGLPVWEEEPTPARRGRPRAVLGTVEADLSRSRCQGDTLPFLLELPQRALS